MTNETLKNLIERAERWPKEAQAELAQVALEIEASITAGTYRASTEELAGIDRGLRDAAAGTFASQDEVEGVFAKHRRG
jgi:predicted transcriptional regulator